MTGARSVLNSTVESVAPALPAALAWQAEDMDARAGIDIAGVAVWLDEIAEYAGGRTT